MIQQSNLENFRDIGDISVPEGQLLKNVLWRSDDVSFIPDAQAEQLYEDGLRTIIDLRSHQEAAATGRGPLRNYSVRYVSLPLSLEVGVPDADMGTELKAHSPAQLGRAYARLAQTVAPSIVTGIRVINDSTGATLFHCAAGKDRTGIFAACVLSLLGASEEQITQDYVATVPNVDRVMQRLIPLFRALVPPAFTGNVLPPAGSALMGAPADTMTSMLT